MAFSTPQPTLAADMRLLARRNFVFEGEAYHPGDGFTVTGDPARRRKIRLLVEWGLLQTQQAGAIEPSEPKQPEPKQAPPADADHPGDAEPAVYEDEPEDEEEEQPAAGEPETEPDLKSADPETMARLRRYLLSLGKPEIASWAKEVHGIDTDRRQTKPKLVDQVLEAVRAKVQGDAANP